jgi:hypothetical protein
MKKALALFVALLFFAAWWLMRSPSRSLDIPTQVEEQPAAVAVSTATNSISPVATAGTVGTTQTEMNSEVFQHLADTILNGLPTTEDLQALPTEETHRTPKPLIAAGEEVGEIVEAIQKNPALAPQGIDFYQKCARKAELATSARALCLANMRELVRDKGGNGDETGIDADIQKLADKLSE